MDMNAKQQGLLKDLQNDEKMCAEKYTKAAMTACDPVLRNLFSSIAQDEKAHYDAVTEMLSGKIPQPKNNQSIQPMPASQLQSKADSAGRQADQYLLQDLLATEKYTAGVYNNSVFEFSSEQERQVLNGIQGQEQHHGKLISDYMQANGMYC